MRGWSWPTHQGYDPKDRVHATLDVPVDLKQCLPGYEELVKQLDMEPKAKAEIGGKLARQSCFLLRSTDRNFAAVVVKSLTKLVKSQPPS